MHRLQIPASTSNLGAGFDTVGLALQLYLTVSVAIGDSDTQIDVTGEGSDQIAVDDSNLILRAARRLAAQQHLTLPPLKLEIDNQIPLRRGLGSSGAATIAGLLTARSVLQVPVSDEALLSLAVEIEGHPENAAASLFGGLTINCQHDAGMISRRILVDPALRAILLIPESEIATEQARAVLPSQVTLRDAVFNTQRSALLTHAFLNKSYDDLRIAMQDCLHQPHRKKLMPFYDAFEATAYDAGAHGVCISGSGSAILALVAEKGESVVRAWQQGVAKSRLSARVLEVAIDTRGATY